MNGSSFPPSSDSDFQRLSFQDAKRSIPEFEDWGNRVVSAANLDLAGDNGIARGWIVSAAQSDLHLKEHPIRVTGGGRITEEGVIELPVKIGDRPLVVYGKYWEL